jgi:hypothetical protein
MLEAGCRRTISWSNTTLKPLKGGFSGIPRIMPLAFVITDAAQLGVFCNACSVCPPPDLTASAFGLRHGLKMYQRRGVLQVRFPFSPQNCIAVKFAKAYW